MRQSSAAELDQAARVLADRKGWWACLPVTDRMMLARRSIDCCLAAADDLVRASCEAKRLDPNSAQSAEEWLAGPLPIVRNLRLLVNTLTEIERSGRPVFASDAVHRAVTGELAVRVFPDDRYARLFYPGTRIDVWMQGDAVSFIRQPTSPAEGRVALVLGAGNISSIGPMDALYKLFVEHRVVLLKMHPVNDYVGPIIERMLEPFVTAGCLRVVYGDAGEGQYLIHHPAVDEIHMTGSAAVHDRVVWGDTAEEQSRRRQARTPKVTKRITSELGCVTPVIIVPGPWSPAEVAYQAENVATMVAHNASCNCNAAKLLVTSRSWPTRQAFLESVEHLLSSLPPRHPYYPGSAARYERFLAAQAATRPRPTLADGGLPYATIFDIDSADVNNVVFREEAWSPVLAETALDAADVGEFVDAAVRFCNQHVAGTLSAVVLVHPETRRRLGPQFDRALASLRYGTVAINHWAAMNYALAVAPWGAYPGHTLEEVGSGIGFVHNTRMFERPLKTVLWGPLTTKPKPAWFCTHQRAHVVVRRMVRFEAAPAIWRVPGIALAGLRG